ncbi:hypothetical protein CcrColossus_gp372 [Caulobacter phage CcrColossus]|uniref:Uncharacterized protein n=1 Tax=Caulobacter phage CcrColossus TaxID=1211640 RepID=K4K6N5_9CAUD|nr:hypothetical protein CcrColossus_gp372 [Caulobacter phage CcrColossus]AFU88242.1 hypothetical protein CcrColossus_gp372 [Caulobacter phage CcrColossus]
MTVAVVSFSSRPTPASLEIVDWTTVQMKDRFYSSTRIARLADPGLKSGIQHAEFNFVYGFFDTFEEAYERRKSAFTLWKEKSAPVEALDADRLALEKKLASAIAACEEAEQERKEALKAHFEPVVTAP